jgi:hypothetical protein
MFLRFQFGALFEFLKQRGYSESDMSWISDLLKSIMADTTTALGIPL